MTLIVLILILASLTASLLLTIGTADMMANHPEYKGEDFLKDEIC